MSIEPASEISNGRKAARRPHLRVALTGGNPSERASIKETIGGLGVLEVEVVEVEEFQPIKFGNGVARPAALIVILEDQNQVHWRRDLRGRKATEGAPFVIAAVRGDHMHQSWSAALKAGADDVLSLPPTRDEALRSLLRASALQHQDGGAVEKIVCSLVSLSGGVGVTSLTLDIGLAIERLFDRRIALVELDLQAAPLASMLDVVPERTISALSDPTSAIDSIRLESVLCKSDLGLYLLAAPKKIEEAELLSADTVEATMKVMRSLFDTVLVDCGSHVNESSVVIWEHSDHVLYVIDQSVTSIRAAQRFLELYERLGIKNVKPAFILNRYVAHSPITVEQVETALNRRLLARLPRDDKSFLEVQVSGQNLWKIASASAIRSNLEALARKLLAAEAEETTAKGGLLSRLRGAVGL